MDTIFLSEDNAGGLLIGNANQGWYNVTVVQNESSFLADASAMAEGDVSDWGVEHYDHDDTFSENVIASFEDGKVDVLEKPGFAGRAYLRLPRED